MVSPAITGTVPTHRAILARIQISLGADAAEAQLATKGHIASISNAGKINHSMFSTEMSLGNALIASVNLKTSKPADKSKFAQVLSIRNIQKDAYLRRPSSTRAPW